jgi:5-methylthioadenosine/S-adenosylhomocysteine deaminase
MTDKRPFPEKADTLITGGHVLCIDDDFTEYENGAVAIEGNSITGIGHAREAASVVADTFIDTTNTIVMPGFVNTHCHAAMTLFRGLVNDCDTQSFLEKIWAVEAEYLRYETIFAGSTLAAAEMALGGITHFVDMYRQPRATIKASEKIGISITSGTSFIGFSRPDSPSWEDKIRLAAEFIEEYRQGADQHLMMMPHSAYTVDAEKLGELNKIAERYGLSMHTHCSESPEEAALVKEMHGDVLSNEVFRQAGMFERGALLAHSICLQRHEIAEMAELSVAVSHCPLSNAKTGSGIAPIVELRNEGVTVSLGTDGAATGNDLDLWKAMRHAGFMQNLANNSATNLSARDLVAMATRDGARAIGKAREFGSLQIGKRADVVVVDMSALHLTPSYDPYSSLAYAAGREDVKHVFARGRHVVKDRSVQVDLAPELEIVRHTAQSIKSNVQL